MPSSRPDADERALALVELLEDLAQLGQRRLARQLLDDLPVGAGDRQLGAERCRALGDARQERYALEDQPHGASLDDTTRRETAPRAIDGPRAGVAAEHRHVLVALAHREQQASVSKL